MGKTTQIFNFYYGQSQVIKHEQQLLTIYSDNKQKQNKQMRPLYFCTNCKQYHSGCPAHKSNTTNSIQFLRFADLFNEVPIPNSQNFTISADSNNLNSRLVYASNSVHKRTVLSSHSKCKTSRNYLQQTKINKKMKQETQNIAQQDSTKFQTQTTAKKLRIDKHYSLTKIKNYQSKTNSITNLKQKVQGTYRKRNLYEHQKKFNTKNGPYYVTTKLYPKKGHNQTTKITIGKEASSQKKSSIQNSYVYGDTDRKLLTSKKVEEFGVNILNQSRQQSSTEVDLKNQKSINTLRFNQSETQRLQNINKLGQRSKVDPYMSIDQATINDQFQINYADRMEQLKRILKSNQQKHEKKIGIEKDRIKQSSMIDKDKKIGAQKITITLKQRQAKNNEKFIDISYGKALQKIHNMKLYQKDGEKVQINKTYYSGENKKCKFYDNRCLGFSFFDEGEVNFINGKQQIL